MGRNRKKHWRNAFEQAGGAQQTQPAPVTAQTPGQVKIAGQGKATNWQEYQKGLQTLNAQFNALTPAQLGQTFNPYSAGQGRVSYWD